MYKQIGGNEKQDLLHGLKNIVLIKILNKINDFKLQDYSNMSVFNACKKYIEDLNIFLEIIDENQENIIERYTNIFDIIELFSLSILNSLATVHCMNKYMQKYNDFDEYLANIFLMLDSDRYTELYELYYTSNPISILSAIFKDSSFECTCETLYSLCIKFSAKEIKEDNIFFNIAKDLLKKDQDIKNFLNQHDTINDDDIRDDFYEIIGCPEIDLIYIKGLYISQDIAELIERIYSTVSVSYIDYRVITAKSGTLLIIPNMNGDYTITALIYIAIYMALEEKSYSKK